MKIHRSFHFILICLAFLSILIASTSSAGAAQLTAFSTAYFAGSGVCAQCHSGLYDESGADVSIDSHWRSTMMANASKDPIWKAKVASEVTRNPKFTSVIEEKCATCHMPMAKTQAKFEDSAVEIGGKGYLYTQNPLYETAMDGVSCTLCHQILDSNLGSGESFSGNYKIDPSTERPARYIFGPYREPFGNPMRNMAGFTPAYSSHITTSELCATCHTLFTPTVDAGGNVVGEFPEQTPYLEWKHSVYGSGGDLGKSCQQCHMPEARGTVVISNRPGRLGPRSPFSKHFFVGGNAFMLTILEAHLGELRVTASREQLDLTRNRTTNQLTQQTAQIAIETVHTRNTRLEVDLEIRNKAGHKFPTGFPSRRAWIHFIARDAGGKVILESGGFTPTGAITGNNADSDHKGYETHYDIIDGSDKVQIYEGIMKNPGGAITYTLLEAGDFIKDNRLLPKGFRKDKADPVIAVKGSATNDKNFIDGSDSITYLVETAGFQRPYTLTAELLFQTVSYRFLRDLFNNEKGNVIAEDLFRLDAPVVISKTEMRFE
jgi:hypothetical protein